MTVPIELLRARACLQRLQPELSGRVHALIEQYGPLDALRRLHAAHPRLPPAEDGEPRLERCLEQAEADLEAADRLGINLLVPEDDRWPNRLAGHRLTQPYHAIALWVRGNTDLATLAHRAVTVLADSASGAYGIEVADLLGYQLVQHGATLISDTSHGVAAAAQRSGIRASGGAANVAVLPCGPEWIYPPNAMDILEHVADHGAVVSTYPPGTPPRPANRSAATLLAATLGRAALLVQANLDSPLLEIVRGLANDMPLLAVPGPITSRGSAGPHQLLRSRCTQPVTCAAEVLEAFHP